MKCICKKCEDCRLYLTWDMENHEGLRKQVKKCAIMVVAEEIPRLKGSVDGLQGGVNEARNRSMETKKAISGFVEKAKKTLEVVSNVRLIGEK